MLIRFDDDDAIAFSQPAHAWLSGQLARAWSERFEPWEEVCLAAEQHDIGWLHWETEPRLNPETGRPHTFRDIPRDQHLGLWSQASTLALAYGRYVALLVSLHGTGLYERFGPDPSEVSPDIQRSIDGLLERERAFQQRQISNLSNDPKYAPHATPEVIDANRRLISLWDAMSLALCGGINGSQSVAGQFTFASRSRDSDGRSHITECVSVDPWPFDGEDVALIVEGRRLTRRFDSDSDVQDALNSAAWTAVEIELVPN